MVLSYRASTQSTGLVCGASRLTVRTIDTLEAYPGFTDAAIAAMAQEAALRFDLQDWRIVHRVGPISPGEAIVFVATAAAHRRAAFEACDHLMDWLKSRAPFWKQEQGPGGSRWIEPTDRDLADAKRWDRAAD